MEAPSCLKCHSVRNMVESDSGPTYQSWVCTECKVPRTIKTTLGKALPFAGIGLALFFGLSHHSDNSDTWC